MVLSTTGPRRVAHAATHRNVGDPERAVSAAIGGLFVASGLRKRGLGGLALAVVGAELMRRGATGHCMLYDVLGFDSTQPGMTLALDGHRSDVRGAAATVNARKSIKVEQSVTIRKPSGEIYAFWRDFSNLPEVLDHLESVSDLGNGRSHWVTKGPAGTRIEWDSEIVNDISGELIAWKTIGHPDVAHAGSVHFTPAGGGTEVKLVMDYEPPAGRLSSVAAKILGESPDQKIRADLERLKALFES